MVHNYCRKTEDPKWSQESMIAAVEAVCAGEKCAKVARQYDIPRQTLQKKIKIFCDTNETKFSIEKGSKPVFNESQEKF